MAHLISSFFYIAQGKGGEEKSLSSIQLLIDQKDYSFMRC